MIWTIAELAAIFAEAFLIARLMVCYFGYRFEGHAFMKSTLLFTVIFIIDCIGTFLWQSEYVFIFGFIASTFLFSLYFLKGSLFEKLLISAASYTLIYLVNLPILSIISIISEMTITELTVAQNASRIACLFCTKLLYFVATQCVLWLRRKGPYQFRLNEWIIVIAAFVVTLIIGFAMYMITLQNTVTDFGCLLITLLLSMLDIVIFVFTQKMNVSRQNETKRELLQLQLNQQQIEIQHLDEQYKEFAIQRHDYQNKINCLYTLLEQDKYSDAKKYAQKLVESDFGNIYPHIQSSSSVLNSVINAKLNKAAQENINTSCRIVVFIPQHMEYDMSILLSNLLDNAIEACVKNTIPSEIVLTLTETAGYYRIVVKNTIQQSILKYNRNLESDKQEKVQHGWGLRSVRGIAEKYKGATDIYEKNGQFIVSVILMKGDFSDMGD